MNSTRVTAPFLALNSTALTHGHRGPWASPHHRQVPLSSSAIWSAQRRDDLVPDDPVRARPGDLLDLRHGLVVFEPAVDARELEPERREEDGPAQRVDVLHRFLLRVDHVEERVR